MNTSEQFNEFTIVIDFEKVSQRPARVFNAMAKMIDAFNDLDKNLAKSFAFHIEPILILQDIESGSIKTRLASAIKLIDDDALKELNWKKAVGSFLLKGKHKILKFLEDKNEITSIEQVNELEKEILQLAKETDIQHIPSYTTVPTKNLLESIADLTMATYTLSEKDMATLISVEGEAIINPRFSLSSEAIEELLTKHTVTRQLEMILLVKKPDYLGQSMWDVQYRGRTIQSKILDIEWLQKFHNRDFGLLPGDSLRAIVHVEIKLGDKNAVVGEHYNILKVIEVLKQATHEQQKFE